ncbi:MAG: hypothetical protein KDA93_12110 [Planctomycetaceae bacterium]|nr:hypothetical protein [Planctomycetaceae bacterium]
MTPVWVARLPLTEAACAARLRIDPDVLAAEHDGHLWLRTTGTGDVEAFRQRLPEATLLDILDDEQLVPWGDRVPTDRLPDVDWRPLVELLPVETSLALHAGRPRNRSRLTLVPSSTEQSPSVLVTFLDTWAKYAVTTPEVRLQRWRFAISASGEAIILGNPLPPLPGRLYVDHAGLACPIGWTWSPSIDANVLREMLGVPTGDLALMDEGSSTIIESRCFATVTRSSVRASWEASRHV